MIDPQFVIKFLEAQPLTPQQRRYAAGVAGRMLELVMTEVIATPREIPAAVIIAALAGTLAACVESQRDLAAAPTPAPPSTPPPPSTPWN